MARKRKDQSPKRKLAENEGTLWLEIEQDELSLHGLDPSDITDQIVKFVRKAKVGKYDGRSQGSGAFDVSFKVKNREAGAVVLRKMMEETYPSLTFSLSDEYECMFHKAKDEDLSLSAQIEKLEMNARYIASSLSSLSERVRELEFGKSEKGALP